MSRIKTEKKEWGGYDQIKLINYRNTRTHGTLETRIVTKRHPDPLPTSPLSSPTKILKFEPLTQRKLPKIGLFNYIYIYILLPNFILYVYSTEIGLEDIGFYKVLKRNISLGGF